jgi:uncharacterized protein YhaN
MNLQEVKNLIVKEREETARATAKVWYAERRLMFSEAAKERKLHAETRELLAKHAAERLADRKRLRTLERRADLSEQVAPLRAENAALSARVAELEAARVALPAPEPRADEIAEMRTHRAKKKAAAHV